MLTAERMQGRCLEAVLEGILEVLESSNNVANGDGTKIATEEYMRTVTDRYLFAEIIRNLLKFHVRIT